MSSDPAQLRPYIAPSAGSLPLTAKAAPRSGMVSMVLLSALLAVCCGAAVIWISEALRTNRPEAAPHIPQTISRKTPEPTETKPTPAWLAALDCQPSVHPASQPTRALLVTPTPTPTPC